jgi:hypothetical protein
MKFNLIGFTAKFKEEAETRENRIGQDNNFREFVISSKSDTQKNNYFQNDIHENTMCFNRFKFRNFGNSYDINYNKSNIDKRKTVNFGMLKTK